MTKGLTLILVACLVLSVSAPASGESNEDAMRLLNEANALTEKAGTREDLETAVQKCGQALRIFDQAGNEVGVGATTSLLGDVYRKLGKYGKAVESYEQSLAIARKIGAEAPEGVVLSHLGNLCRELGQYSNSLEYFEHSIEIFRKIGNLQGVGSNLGGLGLVYIKLGNNAKAADSLEQSLEIARTTGNVEGERLSLDGLGQVYAALGNNAKALESFEQSLAMARKIGDARGEALGLLHLGLIYERWGQYSKAVECYEKALEIAKKVDEAGIEGNTLSNLGGIYATLGKYDKAAEYFGKALELARRIGQAEGEAHILNSWGWLLASWGQYSKAVEYYEKSLEIARRIGHVELERRNLYVLGSVYKDWGQYDKAGECIEQSLEMARKIGNIEGEGQALGSLGKLYASLGQYEKGIEYLQGSMEIMRKLGDLKNEGTILAGLAFALHARGRLSEAVEILKKNLQICQNIGVSTAHTNAQIGDLLLDMGNLEEAERYLKETDNLGALGRLHLVKGDYATAADNFETIRQWAEQNRNVNALCLAFIGLGICYEALGDNPRAVDYYSKAIEQTEDLRAGLGPTERETFFDVRNWGFYRTAPYEGLARVLLKMSRPVEAFNESEYTRARVFAERISKGSGETGLDVPAEVRKKDTLLNDQVAALVKNLHKAYEKGNQEVIAVMEPQVKEAKQKLSVHVDTLRNHYPLFAATRYPQPMRLEQTALNSNEYVLAYDVTDSAVLVYLLKGKELVKGLLKPVSRKELEGIVRKFREPMEVKSGESVNEKLKTFDFATGKKLSDLLLSEVIETVPKGAPLIIVPDESLGLVPFEMLILNHGGKVVSDKGIPRVVDAEFFGDRHSISYYQSINALTLARTFGQPKERGKKLLAVADPVFESTDARAQKMAAAKEPSEAKVKHYEQILDGIRVNLMGKFDLSRLKLTSELAQSLKEIFRGQADVFTGFEASKSGFFNNIGPALPGYDKIVFATHGYFGKDMPGIMEPCLVLTLLPPGTDGYLRMTEIMGLKMNADIVALTACQTGLGRHISGEGTMGMGRAFQYAGTKSVLMSLWSVSEITSVELMKSFFKFLNEGKTKLEAHRLARNQLRKDGFDHPFFWAAFVLAGEPN